ncbi:hypothetical protein ASPFODRAFT_602597 [Aspergillus luchuensis CBS 106.47]|uniref:Uncharacterized protein n=1 Tax=Aspergillus luchuensis (strain CBS 106.47) TaxID=1137211 RepID=A0A1M3TIC1_ASPLC|nr:hypothetical protein ASPFODRAFT_602597 [Aspergillus luchuensis CBS 106.47]
MDRRMGMILQREAGYFIHRYLSITKAVCLVTLRLSTCWQSIASAQSRQERWNRQWITTSTSWLVLVLSAGWPMSVSQACEELKREGKKKTQHGLNSSA